LGKNASGHIRKRRLERRKGVQGFQLVIVKRELQRENLDERIDAQSWSTLHLSRTNCGGLFHAKSDRKSGFETVSKW
jgi:hypothetical protein